jgi:hypothetical protein
MSYWMSPQAATIAPTRRIIAAVFAAPHYKYIDSRLDNPPDHRLALGKGVKRCCSECEHLAEKG